ncbi:hypothetical protein Mycsm_02615 [Mycobacterium sp. JS623]|nr:hypothetical protein Mycsm_02615 [Mycobacterium sp. JS623]
MTPASDEHFWVLAERLCAEPNVTRSTMMGLPCLRCDGQFFGCLDRRSGELVVKLAQTRVDKLVGAGHARPFAPAGRRFRQWATISVAQQDLWGDYLAEAMSFVMQAPDRSPDPRRGVSPTPTRRPQRTHR